MSEVSEARWHRKKANPARKAVQMKRRLRRLGKKVPAALLKKASNAEKKHLMNRVVPMAQINKLRIVAGKKAHTGAARNRALRTLRKRTKRGLYLKKRMRLAASYQPSYVRAIIESVADKVMEARKAAELLRVRPEFTNSPQGFAVIVAASGMAEDAVIRDHLADVELQEDVCTFYFTERKNEDLSERLLKACKNYGEAEILAKPGDKIEEGFVSDLYIVDFVPSNALIEQFSAGGEVEGEQDIDAADDEVEPTDS